MVVFGKVGKSHEDESVFNDDVSPKGLEESRKLWIRESQKGLKTANEFRTLPPFIDEEGIIRPEALYF